MSAAVTSCGVNFTVSSRQILPSLQLIPAVQPLVLPQRSSCAIVPSSPCKLSNSRLVPIWLRYTIHTKHCHFLCVALISDYTNPKLCQIQAWRTYTIHISWLKYCSKCTPAAVGSTAWKWSIPGSGQPDCVVSLNHAAASIQQPAACQISRAILPRQDIEQRLLLLPWTPPVHGSQPETPKYTTLTTRISGRSSCKNSC